MPKPCAFCHLAPERVIFSNEHAVAFDDGYPVSPGHALAIPRRHVGSWFELTAEERLGVLDLVDRLHTRLVEGRAPAFNIGINDGRAAGQTVPHVHVHLIPGTKQTCPTRVAGALDSSDKARYWEQK